MRTRMLTRFLPIGFAVLILLVPAVVGRAAKPDIVLGGNFTIESPEDALAKLGLTAQVGHSKGGGSCGGKSPMSRMELTFADPKLAPDDTPIEIRFVGRTSFTPTIQMQVSSLQSNGVSFRGCAFNFCPGTQDQIEIKIIRTEYKAVYWTAPRCLCPKEFPRQDRGLPPVNLNAAELLKNGASTNGLEDAKRDVEKVKVALKKMTPQELIQAFLPEINPLFYGGYDYFFETLVNRAIQDELEARGPAAYPALAAHRDDQTQLRTAGNRPSVNTIGSVCYDLLEKANPPKSPRPIQIN
ncbi:MAG: hypothetical protein PCFJNLEI_03621 [Verrucomicrobiae bacterium]|nr:hypothetical protein [Verrucomicrobiae bacterium]